MFTLGSQADLVKRMHLKPYDFLEAFLNFSFGKEFFSTVFEAKLNYKGINWYFICYHSQHLPLHIEVFCYCCYFVETHYSFSFLMSFRFINSKDMLYISMEKLFQSSCLEMQFLPRSLSLKLTSQDWFLGHKDGFYCL